MCASSTKFLVFIGDHLLFSSHFSLSQKCSLKCVVFQEFFRLIFSRFVYLAFKKRSKSGSYRLKQRFDPTATFCTFEFNKYKKPLRNISKILFLSSSFNKQFEKKQQQKTVALNIIDVEFLDSSRRTSMKNNYEPTFFKNDF